MNFKRNKGWLLVLLFTLHAHNATAGVCSATLKTVAALFGLGCIGTINREMYKNDPDGSFIIGEAGILMFIAHKIFFEKQPEPSTLSNDLQLKNIEPSCNLIISSATRTEV